MASDSFIKNIIEHSERLTAIIENTDFSNHALNPNIILIPSLWNNINDALVVWAMDAKSHYGEECRKKAEFILRKEGILSDDAENWLAAMKNLRTVYTSDFPEMEFNKNDCMIFLNAYDNFMYLFYTSCPAVQRALHKFGTDYKKICSMRETFLKNISCDASCEKIQLAEKKPATSPQNSQIEENSVEALLLQLIKETQKTNQLLEKLLSRG